MEHTQLHYDSSSSSSLLLPDQLDGESTSKEDEDEGEEEAFSFLRMRRKEELGEEDLRPAKLDGVHFQTNVMLYFWTREFYFDFVVLELPRAQKKEPDNNTRQTISKTTQISGLVLIPLFDQLIFGQKFK